MLHKLYKCLPTWELNNKEIEYSGTGGNILKGEKRPGEWMLFRAANAPA